MYMLMPYPGMVSPFGYAGMPAPGVYVLVPIAYPAGLPGGGGFVPGPGGFAPGMGVPGVPGGAGIPGLPGFPGIPNIPGLVGAGIGAASGIADAAAAAPDAAAGAIRDAVGNIVGAAAGAAGTARGNVLKGANEVLDQLGELMNRGVADAKRERDRLRNAGQKAGRAATKELKDAIAFAEDRVKSLEEGAKNIADAAGHVLGSLFGKK